MIVAAVMPMLVGAGAISIDVGQWIITRRHLQRAADTGAIAGANAVLHKSVAKNAVEQSLEFNNQEVLSSAVIVENAPTVGTYAGDMSAVRVVVSATPQLTFISFFMSGPTTLTAEATAKAVPDPRYCMVALEDGPSIGFDFSGAAGVKADCGLMTNSRAKPSAVNFGGNSASVTATEVGAVGQVGAASNWGAGTKLLSYQATLADPYEYAPDASTLAVNCGSALVVEGSSWTNRTLKPGCWSGGLTIKRDIVLEAGTYVVNGGELRFESNAVVKSSGPITFVLTGGTPTTIAQIKMAGGATINATAPTTGPLKDILFYQDRRAKYLGSENLFIGNSGSTMLGSLYFPTSNLTFTGNSGTTGVCAQIVARRITMTGSSEANLSCSGSHKDRMAGQTVRLVA